jgi:hypothetical protein
MLYMLYMTTLYVIIYMFNTSYVYTLKGPSGTLHIIHTHYATLASSLCLAALYRAILTPVPAYPSGMVSMGAPHAIREDV